MVGTDFGGKVRLDDWLLWRKQPINGAVPRQMSYEKEHRTLAARGKVPIINVVTQFYGFRWNAKIEGVGNPMGSRTDQIQFQ